MPSTIMMFYLIIHQKKNDRSDIYHADCVVWDLYEMFFRLCKIQCRIGYATITTSSTGENKNSDVIFVTNKKAEMR